MTDISDLIAVMDEELQKVDAIPDSRVTHFATRVAFYAAMLDASEDDPIEDEDTHRAVWDYLTTQYREALDAYQSLVNDNL